MSNNANVINAVKVFEQFYRDYDNDVNLDVSINPRTNTITIQDRLESITLYLPFYYKGFKVKI